MYIANDLLTSFGGTNHITGTAEPKLIKFCTQIGYINSGNKMTYHPQKRRGYGHVTVLVHCCCSHMLAHYWRLPWLLLCTSLRTGFLTGIVAFIGGHPE